MRVVAIVLVALASGCEQNTCDFNCVPYDARKPPPDAPDPFAGTVMLRDLHGGTQGTTQTDLWGVVIADLNGDGRPDIAIVEFAGFVDVWLDTTPAAAATPTLSGPTEFAVGISPEAIATADIDGDGRPDLITSNQGGYDLSVLIDTTVAGAATPSFATETRITGIPQIPARLAAADFNGDGKQDLAILAYGTSAIALNTTAGAGMTPSFSASTTLDTGFWADVAMADFNGDGRPDIALGNVNVASVRVRFDATPPLATTPSFPVLNDFATTTIPGGVFVGDFNSDGKPDVLAGDALLLDTTPSLSTVPAFAKADITGAVPPGPTYAGDIDGDGQLDLITIVNNPLEGCCKLVVTRGHGDGTFSFYGERLIGPYAGPVALADFNGDGRQDVVVFNDYLGTGIVVLTK